jgi:hypothetical protein
MPAKRSGPARVLILLAGLVLGAIAAWQVPQGRTALLELRAWVLRIAH